MTYNFRILDECDKKSMRLFKKVGIVSFVSSHKIIIHTILAVSAYAVLYFIGRFTPYTKFYGRWGLSAILSVFIAGLLKSLFLAFLNENGIYHKLCKSLKCPVFIKGMLLSVGDEPEEIDGTIIPDVCIRYDVEDDTGNTVVLVKVDDDSYKVIYRLDTSKKGKDMESVVPASSLRQALMEASTGDGLVVMKICQINSENNGYVKDSDIDMRFVAEEAFIPVLNEN